MRQRARFNLWGAARSILRLPLLISLLVFVGCSGGETGTGMNDKSVAPSQLFIGEITGFGSVFVNGIEFDTANSTIQVSGNPGNETDLAVGMVVAVVGDVDDNGKTGTAKTLLFENEVEGNVTANNYPTSLVVMGQTVMIDNDTIFESDVPVITAIKDIRLQQHVEVSGFPTQDGTIYATRIKLVSKPAGQAGVLLKGKVQSLSTDKQQFDIGGMTVNYDAATAIETANALQDGEVVKVTSRQIISGNKPVYAERIDALSMLGKNSNTSSSSIIHMEGAVDSALQNNQFTLNGVTVQVTEATEYRGGQAGNILVGQKLKVKGQLGSDNTLTANSIDFINTSKLSVVATIDAIDYTANSVTVLGQTFYLNSMTILRNDRSNPTEATFNLSQLSLGDEIEIKGYPNASGADYSATSLERSSATTNSVEGIITSIQNGVVQVGPFAIDITQLPPGQFTSTDVGRQVQLMLDSSTSNNSMVATAYTYDS